MFLLLLPALGIPALFAHLSGCLHGIVAYEKGVAMNDVMSGMCTNFIL